MMEERSWMVSSVTMPMARMEKSTAWPCQRSRTPHRLSTPAPWSVMQLTTTENCPVQPFHLHAGPRTKGRLLTATAMPDTVLLRLLMNSALRISPTR